MLQARVTRALQKRVHGAATVARALSLLNEQHYRHAEHKDLAALLAATLSLPPEHGEIAAATQFQCRLMHV